MGGQIDPPSLQEKLPSKSPALLGLSFFFYLGFLSQPFMDHRTAGEGGGHFFNSSLPLISQMITAQSSLLDIGSSQIEPRTFGFQAQLIT